MRRRQVTIGAALGGLGAACKMEVPSSGSSASGSEASSARLANVIAVSARKRVLALSALLVACGGTTPPGSASALPSAAPPALATSGGGSSVRPATPPTPPAELEGAARAAPERPAPASIFRSLRSDLVACYEEGRNEVPAMTSGKITYLVSIDASGRTTCVVPSDDTGLTQDVENCMRARLEREVFPRGAKAWSTALPILVRDAELALGEARKAAPSIETVESHGLDEDVYPVVVKLLPELYACVRGIDKSADLRVVYVGGRVDAAGRVACSVTSSAAPIDQEIRDCTSRVLMGAKFRPPKRGYGLVSVPLKVLSRR
jgi:hypothetical protein